MQVITLDLAYCTAADPLTTHTPRDPEDITRFLAGISGMCPSLRALKVTAMRRAVAVDPTRMPLQHLALACRELTLAKVAKSLGHHVDVEGCSVPASLHFLFVTAPHETVSPIAIPGHPAPVHVPPLCSNEKEVVDCIQQKHLSACTWARVSRLRCVCVQLWSRTFTPADAFPVRAVWRPLRHYLVSLCR